MLLADAPPEPAYGTGVLLLIAAAAVAVLLLLIIKLKVHAFVALVLVSLLTALATRIPLTDVPATLLDGFGGTLAAVALLVGLGVMIGRLLEITGGAQVLADTLIMDVKTTFKTWTVMETLIGLVGFVLAFTLSLVL